MSFYKTFQCLDSKCCCETPDPLLERLPKITSDAMFLATFGGVIALIVLISFLLSLKLYERREF
jgi:hypothetical protein